MKFDDGNDCVPTSIFVLYASLLKSLLKCEKFQTKINVWTIQSLFLFSFTIIECVIHSKVFYEF